MGFHGSFAIGAFVSPSFAIVVVVGSGEEGPLIVKKGSIGFNPIAA